MSDSSQISSEDSREDSHQETEQESSPNAQPATGCMINTEPPTPVLGLVSNDGKAAHIRWEIGESNAIQTYTVLIEAKGKREERIVHAKETILDDMEPGCLYGVCVRAKVRNLEGPPSEVLAFPSAPLPPTNVRTIQNRLSPEDSVFVKFEDPGSRDKEYVVTIEDLTDGASNPTSHITGKTTLPIKGLKPEGLYRVYVQARIKCTLGDAFLRSAKAHCNDEFQTYPSQPAGLEKAIISSQSYNITWPRTPGAECYILRWKNDKVVDYECRETAETSVILDKLTPGSTYLMSVVAKNAAGTGKYSEPLLFRTPPCAPVDLNVEKYDSSPESAFVVSFVDPDPNPDGKEYRVVGQPLSQNEDVTETMEKSLILLKGLKPGETYKISAEIVDKKAELKSEKTFSNALCQTYPAEVGNLKVILEHDCLLITWEPLELAPRRYQISMNVNGQDMPPEFTEKPSFIVTNVSASSIYKVAVAAENDAGCGKFCEPEKCQTRPAGPLKVMAKQNPINRSSSLSVWMEDHDPVEKMYKVVAVDPNDQKLVVETPNKYAVFNDLKSATPYRIFVVAILGKLESDPVWVSQLS